MAASDHPRIRHTNGDARPNSKSPRPTEKHTPMKTLAPRPKVKDHTRVRKTSPERPAPHASAHGQHQRTPSGERRRGYHVVFSPTRAEELRATARPRRSSDTKTVTVVPHCEPLGAKDASAGHHPRSAQTLSITLYTDSRKLVMLVEHHLGTTRTSGNVDRRPHTVVCQRDPRPVASIVTKAWRSRPRW
jgi:hypothetical protein